MCERVHVCMKSKDESIYLKMNLSERLTVVSCKIKYPK